MVSRGPDMSTVRVNGRNLRALRRLRGWSLTDVAAQCDVTVSHLSRVEREERDLSVKQAERIAEAFGVPVGVLLTIQEVEEAASA